MGTRIRGLNNSLLYNYQYDQLNRLVAMNAWNRTGSAWNAITKIPDFKENIAYDPNGNILKYKRNGDSTIAHNSAHSQTMDSLGYSYISGTNKLDHITDAVTSSGYGTDITSQASGTYQYDSIGQLISDVASGITNISWTVYGKIASIVKTGGTTLYFTYDPGGNRISKSVVNGTDTTTTWYVRDAQGNVMSVYTYGDPAVHGRDLTQTELQIYGNGRLGILKMSNDVELAPTNALLFPPLAGIGNNITFTRGNKLFELTNHLGNVLATVSDKRYGVVAAPADTTVAYFIPDLVSANDYYPFGSLEPYRSYAKSGAGYRYGFNGKEKDDEVKGTGNEIDYGMRVYDPRVAKFMSVDPLTKDYPELTPYQYASNSPVSGIDVDGLEYLGTMDELPSRTFSEGAGNSLYNIIAKGWNSAAGTWNGAVNFVKDASKNGLGSAVMQAPQTYYENSIKPTVDYITKTPAKQQLKDAIQDAKNPQTYFDAFNNAVVIVGTWKLGSNEPAPTLGKATISDVAATTKKSTITANRELGALREVNEKAVLEKLYPDAAVQAQRYLRDAKGKIIKDKITGTARRIDFAVIKDGKALDLVETTSLTANKAAQIAKEKRIRNAGGIYIRDAKTKKLVDVSNVGTRLSRRN